MVKTQVFNLPAVMKDSEFSLEAAACILHKGGLVAFPTETVYGLGASIVNSRALKQLFLVKQRPYNQPFSIQIAHINQVEMLAVDIPLCAYRLMETFFPGPLTVILKKHPRVSSLITREESTVAIRCSSNPFARRLVQLTGCPLAVPSANLSGKPSSVTSDHVLEDFNGKIDCILDGGDSQYGIDSTIISLVNPKNPVVHRLGAVSIEAIEKQLKTPVFIYSHVKKHCQLRVLLFNCKTEIQRYLSSNSYKKRFIISDRIFFLDEISVYHVNSRNLYKHLRFAVQNKYAEILVLCNHQMKKKPILMRHLQIMASC